MIKQILLVGASALAFTATAAEATTTFFGYSGAIVSWTAPTTGLYTIDAWGAQGGQGGIQNRGPSGGYGAVGF